MRKLIVSLSLATALGAAILGISLPGSIMQKKVKKENAIVKQVPASYYMAANMALTQNLSQRLLEEERVKLCTGEWESNIFSCQSSDVPNIAYNAINTAEKFCTQNDIFQFDEWYSYDAKAFKAVDATFNTYLAYFWEAELTKYNHSEKLILKVTESGTVLSLKKIDKNGTEEVLYDIMNN